MNEKNGIKSIISTSDSFRISADGLSQKILDALRGDPEIAWRVCLHYKLAIHNYDEGIKWCIIGIENGSSDAQYSLANTLLNFSNNCSESKIRGIFWLYTMIKNNYRIEETNAWLKSCGYTLETSQPPDDRRFQYCYTQFSETEIASCRIGALQGNRKAALLLGKYYSEIKVDNELSEYWYIVGAQNGSPECQYELGQILLRKDSELDKVRGNFWLRQAIQNGYNVQ